MRAVVASAYGGPEVLVCRELPDPTPGPGQVAIRVHATSVNFADIKARKEGYRGQKPPFIPGLDAAGVVEGLGSDVTGLKVGQRVAAYTSGGSYAEVVLADAVTCYPLPTEVTFASGAGIGIGITAYNALVWAGRLAPGERVLVHAGAGGVGSMAVQLAKALGAGLVIATVGSEAKRDFARACGADEVIDYRTEDFAAQVRELTGGEGVDVILDAIAGVNAERGMTCLADFGRLVIYGHTGVDAATFRSTQLHSQNRAILGYSSGGFRKRRPERLRASAEAVLDLLRTDRLEVPVSARFDLCEAAAAHRLVEGRQSTGKVLLIP